MLILHPTYIMWCGGRRGEWEKMKSNSSWPLEAYPLLLGISYAEKRLSSKQEAMEQGKERERQGISKLHCMQTKRFSFR